LLRDTQLTTFRARSFATHLLNDVFIAAFNLWPRKVDDFDDGYGRHRSGMNIRRRVVAPTRIER